MTDNLTPNSDPAPNPPAKKKWRFNPLVPAVILFLAGISIDLILNYPGTHGKSESLTEATPSPGLSLAERLEAKPEVDLPPAPVSPTTAPASEATPAHIEESPKESPTTVVVQPIEGEGKSIPSPTLLPKPIPMPGSGLLLSDRELATLPEAEAEPESEPDGSVTIEYEESLPHEPSTTIPPNEYPPSKHTGAKVAIIIDDLGYNGSVSLAIARMAEPITLAILPGGEFSRQTATIGKATNKEIILHQPMEPLGYPRVKPGPGGLYMGMSQEQIRPVLLKNLQQFPEAVGINNHMGSRLTQNREAMDSVMDILQERGLFFVDSRTSQTSVAHARAQAKKVPSTKRDVFLDNVQKVSTIKARLAELEQIAHHSGRAVGIGHPHRETLIALQQWLPEATKRGIHVERISQFLSTNASHGQPTTRRAPVAEKPVKAAKPAKIRTESPIKSTIPSSQPIVIEHHPLRTTGQQPGHEEAPTIQDPMEHTLPVDQQ
ncbi:MAG: divergent polysaccharide deacetylase family protein [Magnetococcales bacterium]|nr:divergent polysaccharide deacetylase family protein [Magnetococcales bacterium]MBF0439820.1 divergent polysaccharide deacetylase family protein [Magnetococcales bacterium]